MKNIEELRKEIDSIDKEMKKLFIARMEVSKQIGEYKKEHNLPIFDPKREELMINKIKEANDISEDIKPLYIEFLISLMNISKKHQSK